VKIELGVRGGSNQQKLRRNVHFEARESCLQLEKIIL